MLGEFVLVVHLEATDLRLVSQREHDQLGQQCVLHHALHGAALAARQSQTQPREVLVLARVVVLQLVRPLAAVRALVHRALGHPQVFVHLLLFDQLLHPPLGLEHRGFGQHSQLLLGRAGLQEGLEALNLAQGELAHFQLDHGPGLTCERVLAELDGFGDHGLV